MRMFICQRNDLNKNKPISLNMWVDSKILNTFNFIENPQDYVRDIWTILLTERAVANQDVDFENEPKQKRNRLISKNENDRIKSLWLFFRRLEGSTKVTVSIFYFLFYSSLILPFKGSEENENPLLSGILQIMDSHSLGPRFRLT